MGLPEDHPAILAAKAKGLIPADAPRKREKAELVTAKYISPGTWIVPVLTVSESNERGRWARAGRTIAARTAVSRTIGPWLPALASYSAHYHSGFPLRVVFTRLGGRKLDRSNLATALKAVEDALAMMMGADDGNPKWQAEWEQEPGGKHGVRIELETA